MAIAQVGNWTSAQFNNNTGGSLTGRTSTAGNHVVIGCSTSDAATHTITHSQAGTVQTGRAFETAASGDTYGTSYVENIVGGASHTISVATGANQFTALHATEYSGVATSSSLDKTANGTGTDTTSPFDLTSGATAAVSQNDELVVGVGGIATNSATGTWSGQGGYTLRGNTTAGNIGSVSCLVDLIIAAGGTPAAQARLTDAGGLAGGNGSWLIQTVTFKGATAAAAAETWTDFSPGRFDDAIPGEIRPYEVLGSIVWFDTGVIAASADLSVTGRLDTATVFLADATTSRTVVALLPTGAPLYAPVTADRSIVGHLPTGTDLRSVVSHDISVVGHLPTADPLLSASGTLAYIVTGLLASGAPPYAAASHDVPLVGHLPTGAPLYAPISHNITVAGLLPAAAPLYSTVTHDANLVAHLASASVLYALVSGSADLNTTGLLFTGTFPRAAVTADRTPSGLLVTGTDLHSTVTHTASVVGLLASGAAPYAVVIHQVSLAGYLPLAVVQYAPIGAPTLIERAEASFVTLGRADITALARGTAAASVSGPRGTAKITAVPVGGATIFVVTLGDAETNRG